MHIEMYWRVIMEIPALTLTHGNPNPNPNPNPWKPQP